MPLTCTRSLPACFSWMVVKSATPSGRDVGVRVSHLVDQLLRHARNVHDTAGLGMLRYYERPIG